MDFSELASDFTGEIHPLYVLRKKMLSQSIEVVDLVKGNVTEHGWNFPEDLLGECLHQAARKAIRYSPDPFGQRIAREAIAKLYEKLCVSADDVVLTPGTSVSYWYIFKLLADPGDEILSPVPSYPLLDYIARLCDIRLQKYRLSESHGWAIDFDQLEKQISPKTRAIVVISPHNPTGMVCTKQELVRISEIAFRHGIAIISDEVFGEFLLDSVELPRPAANSAPLVFTLNGLSKSFALPGLKLGWIVVSGDRAFVKRSLDALETISDTFLPVSEYVQFSVPAILEKGREFQRRYIKNVCDLYSIAMHALEGVKLFPPKGGFYFTLPIGLDEETAALSLLENEHILVHPGHFYEIDGNHLVATFIHDPDKLCNSFRSIRSFLQQS